MDLGDERLALAANKDLRKIQGWQQDESESAGLFGNIGGLLGGGAGYMFLAPLLAGLGPIGMALAVGAGSGLGSWAGGKLGASMNPDVDTKFKQSTRIAAGDEVKDQINATAVNNATNAAVTSYSLGLTGQPTTVGEVSPSSIPDLSAGGPSNVGTANTGIGGGYSGERVSPTYPGMEELGLGKSDLVTDINPDLIDSNLPSQNPLEKALAWGGERSQDFQNLVGAPWTKEGWKNNPGGAAMSGMGQLGLLYMLLNQSQEGR